jgi:hypothetical protein
MVLEQHAPQALGEGSGPGDLVLHLRSVASEYAAISSREVVTSRAEVRGDNAVHLDEPLGMLS